MRDCKECGDEIGEARLQARPYAEFCITCQEERERRGEFRRPKLDIQPVMEAGEMAGTETRFIEGSRT